MQHHIKSIEYLAGLSSTTSGIGIQVLGGLMNSKPRRKWLAILMLSIWIIIVIWWGWVPDDPGCYRTTNAAWIAVDWVDQPPDQPAIQSLTRSAAERDIRYLYVYTSYLTTDGTFNPTYDHAAAFIEQVRQADQGILLLAWIGIPLANERSIGVQGWVDLADQETRQQIVDFAVTMVDDLGFDGIHLNAETVYNHNPDYLLLLQELDKALEPDTILSIAGSQWMPDVLNHLPLIHDFRWTGDYYRQVSSNVDQIATMTYDSYAIHPALYRLWMREEVRGLQRSLADYEDDLLIGISVSTEQTRSHRPRAENLSSGLAGLCAAADPVFGVAVYADWDFSEQDRQTWNSWRGE